MVYLLCSQVYGYPLLLIFNLTILPSIFHFLLKYNLTEKNKDLMKIAK